MLINKANVLFCVKLHFLKNVNVKTIVFFVSFYKDLSENVEQLKGRKYLKMEQQSSSIISSEAETNIER